MESKGSIEVTCPECRGPLSEVRLGEIVEYRCLVGHTYSAWSVLAAHSEIQERALWSAVVALEEAGNLVRVMAPELRPEVARKLEAQAAEKRNQAKKIREVLASLEPFQVE